MRMMLRKISGKAPGERYQWKPSDPFLKKLPGLIEAEKKKAEEAKAKAAKKSLALARIARSDAGFVRSLRDS